MKKFALILVAAVTASLASGCCSSPEKIYIGYWELEEKTLAGASHAWPEPMNDITFEIKPDGSFFGNSGVNRYFGKAVLDTVNGKVKLETQGMTKMAGHGQEYEAAFIKMLGTVDAYKICGDDMSFISNGKVVARFDHEIPDAD